MCIVNLLYIIIASKTFRFCFDKRRSPMENNWSHTLSALLLLLLCSTKQRIIPCIFINVLNLRRDLRSYKISIIRFETSSFSLIRFEYNLILKINFQLSFVHLIIIWNSLKMCNLFVKWNKTLILFVKDKRRTTKQE